MLHKLILELNIVSHVCEMVYSQYDYREELKSSGVFCTVMNKKHNCFFLERKVFEEETRIPNIL